MQATEAITRILVLAEKSTQDFRANLAKLDEHNIIAELDQSTPALENEQNELALAVVWAMLNAALPIARFRCFVEVDPVQPARKPSDKVKEVTQEFTVCGITTEQVRSGIVGLTVLPVNVRVMLFEQRPTGAEMISAYQGRTKTGEYRNWLKSLSVFDHVPTIQ